nr:putative ribonuclease H-like domain-containing protein [Tanacetum cinerariifolium]
MDKENLWGKDGTGKDVDLHHYRSMIGSLMYLTASRPDIMFAVCACARHQVTPKECHLHAVQRIFRYITGHPKLGLWYPKESPFDLVAYSGSDYGGATQDRKSTTGRCQFLGRRLVLWQCKKQTIVATSTTEAEYVAAASCCGQVLWIQNQLVDYGDCFKKKLISVDHIHTDENVADLLTKSFDAGRFQYLVCKLFPLLGKLSTVSVFLSFGLTFAGTSNYWGSLRILMISPRLIPLFWSTARIETTDEGTKILATVDGISSLPDDELFENLQLMGYNILPNQKFTFQKGQFSHQWKYLIHTIMQCLSPKNETASSIRDNSQGEACPTDSVLAADQDRANIAKTSTLPSDSALRVTSLAADEGIMQQKLDELTSLGTSLRRQQSEMVSRFEAQELEINNLKARIKLLEDKDKGVADQSRDGAPIKRRRLDEGEEATERVSDDTEEMATVLTSMDAASILTSGGVQVVPTTIEVATATIIIPTGSGVVSTASPIIPTDALIFTTATESTPYTRRKGKKKMVESDTSKKKKLQEQLDVQVARELQEQMAREDQGMPEQIARDAEVARIHAEEELQMMINSLDRSNETVVKYLQELKRKGLRLEQECAKKLKTSEEVPKEVKSSEEVPKEKVKEMMQLVPIEEVYVEALQVKHPIIDWKVHTKGQRTYWKITRKGLAIGMISYKLQVENYSKMANDLILKIYKIASSPRKQDDRRHSLQIIILFWKLDCSWSIKFRGGLLGIKCTRHSQCQLWSSHYQKKFPLPVKKVPTTRRKEMPLLRRLHCC